MDGKAMAGESQRLADNERERVKNRVRRMLAAKRGEPEPMSGAPRKEPAMDPRE